MEMPTSIAELLIDNLIQRFSESLTPQLDAQVLHNKNVFDI